MGSKAFLFLGLFLAIFLMISSEVVARELTETSNPMKSDNENDEGSVYDDDGKQCNYYNRCHHHCRKVGGCK